MIADQGGKLAVQVALHVLRVIGFERPVVRLLEEDDNGHHFAWVHLGWAHTLSLTHREQVMVPSRGKLLPEIVYGTKEFEYTHSGTSWGYAVVFFFAVSYQEWFLIPNSRYLANESSISCLCSKLAGRVY